MAERTNADKAAATRAVGLQESEETELRKAPVAPPAKAPVARDSVRVGTVPHETNDSTADEGRGRGRRKLSLERQDKKNRWANANDNK